MAVERGVAAEAQVAEHGERVDLDLEGGLQAYCIGFGGGSGRGRKRLRRSAWTTWRRSVFGS